MKNYSQPCTNCNDKTICQAQHFHTKVFDKWDTLLQELLDKKYEDWIFRGQLSRYSLQTSLERACKLSPDVGLENARTIERNMIREFQRWYQGESQQDVRNSQLFCLSLMQHYGAPTRLLDWTYSPLVALYFGLQYGYEYNKAFTVWAVDAGWCWTAAREMVGRHKQETVNPVEARRNDENRRTDSSFKKLYMPKKPEPIICPENPYQLHSRLYAQQGVFLCPGDVSVPFEDLLLGMVQRRQDESQVVKLCCQCDQEARQEALIRLGRMNINRATLFGGLDGYAQSLKYRLSFFKHNPKWDRNLRIERP